MTLAQALREAMLEAQLETSNYGETPAASNLYIPPAHIKALNLESTLVVGGRGVGKSFWTAVLGNAGLRSLIGSSVRRLDQAEVCIGFSLNENIDRHPNRDSFSQLLTAGHAPYDIWRAVILHWLAEQLGHSLPVSRWPARVEWLKQNPEDVSRLMVQANQKFAGENRYALFVFDALDRTSNDWRIMDEIVRGLLEAALWLKSFSHLHAKVFLREDQMERNVTNFADASKLLASRATLNWERHDLHGLLWQRLINAPESAGERLRNLFQTVAGCQPSQRDGVWQLPDEARRETPLQRTLFEKLAGPWMGRDPRRGVPYIWSVSHLADGRGQTSPRSFLAAIRQAVEDSVQRYSAEELPIHHESIKRGIRKASDNRVEELAEEFPWIRTFLGCLKGLTVPCNYELILERWQDAFPTGPASASLDDRLPPQHAERGWDGICEDLQRLGLLERKKDGRIDMPDLYRVGFGLGRRGGVKPSSKQ